LCHYPQKSSFDLAGEESEIMQLQFGLTQELTNTQYAPLAALLAYYNAERVLEPLQSVTSATQNGDFSLAEKLEQTLVSILAACE
jgi:hypothetical protein